MEQAQTKISQKGFSLLELLIAISLLAIGLLAVATMQTTAINANSIGNKNTILSALVQEVYEDIMSWPNTSDGTPAGAPDNRFVAGVNSGTYTLVTSSAGNYSATYVISANTPTTGMARVVVTVTDNLRPPVSLTGYKISAHL